MANTGYDLQNGYHIRLVTENTIPKMDIRIRQDNGLKTGHLVKWDYLSDPDDPNSYISRESTFSDLPGHIVEVHRRGHFDIDHMSGHNVGEYDMIEESQNHSIGIKGNVWTVLNGEKRPLFYGTGGVDEANSFLNGTKI
jgi:hypothetical protein